MDPRYGPDAVGHDLASLGLFKGVSPLRTRSPEDGCLIDAPHAEVWTYDHPHLVCSEEILDMGDLMAIQDYWCEQNVERLSQLSPDQRNLPKVLRYEDCLFLMDGTHTCLLSLMETGNRSIRVQVYEVA